MPLSLLEAMERFGYPFRQHLEEEGWTVRKPTVVDLTDAQRTALNRDGTAGLRSALSDEGLWPFPAVDIAAPARAVSETVLWGGSGRIAVVAAPRSSETLWAMADRFVRDLNGRYTGSLTVTDDVDLTFDVLRDGPLVLFGGGGESPLARDLALRFHTFTIDATIPGPGGWAVTTHAGLDGSGNTVVQVWAGSGQADKAMGCLSGAIAREGDGVLLRRVHRIEQGRAMRNNFPLWRSFAEGLPMGLPPHVGGPEPGSEDPAELATQVAKGLDSGGPDVNHYNSWAIDTANTAACYYILSGEPRALQLFRELLWRIADYYLKTPGGASYPADLDFRSGHLVLYWSRLEHEPLFTDQERLVLSNLLLAVTRTTYEYAMKMWPVEPDGPTRHNHETFPARSLAYAADYFRRFGLPYVENWQAYADTVFSGGIWHRFKQRENANHYEQTAYEHASCYSGFCGRRLNSFGEGILESAARRHVAATDNFFRPVDYSDSSASVGVSSADVLATLATSAGENKGLAWYAHQVFARGQNYLGQARGAIPGLRRADPGEPPPSGVWEKAPMDAKFVAEQFPGFPLTFAFDKLAFRTGWGVDDQYLLLEGVGGKAISHAHNEVNGLVRYNHLGRHWVISNGYGRRAGVTNVRDSFSSRVLGPEDHNMLVLRRDGGVVESLPVCGALLQKTRATGYAISTTALLGYGGTHWFRTLVVAADRFLLVIDRIHVLDEGLEGGQVEWNCLGDLTPTSTGAELDQRGVKMAVASPSGWEPEIGESDRSADWQRVLQDDAYPHADFPIKKVSYRMPVSQPGSRHCLTSLLAAVREADDTYRIVEPEPGRFLVDGGPGRLPDGTMGAGDVHLEASAKGMEVRLGHPELPAELEAWCARG